MTSLKLTTLQGNLKAQKIEALLISEPSNVVYLTGFHSSNSYVLMAGEKTYLLTDQRYEIAAKKITKELKISTLIFKSGFIKDLEKVLKKNGIKKLHYEAKNLTVLFHQNLKKNLDGISLKPSTNFIEQLRLSKDEEELKKLQKAQDITDKVFAKLKTSIKIGQTEKELAWEIEQLGREFGADDISFEPIVAFEENSAIPHHHPTDKKLKKGDVILIDMGHKFQDFCSDMTRMLFTQKPTAQQELVYNTVLKAQNQAIEISKNAHLCSEPDREARKIIDDAGFKGKFTHSLGHGIGLDVHESPGISIMSTQKIAPKTVFTVEPGIYLENEFGVRIEDMIYKNGTKIINLTRSPKKLQDCLINI